jgi:hypothetical protein
MDMFYEWSVLGEMEEKAVRFANAHISKSRYGAPGVSLRMILHPY